MIPIPDEMYLGDGVYVAIRPGALVLTTRKGAAVTNAVVLDGPAFQNLLDFVQAHAAEARARELRAGRG